VQDASSTSSSSWYLPPVNSSNGGVGFVKIEITAGSEYFTVEPSVADFSQRGAVGSITVRPKAGLRPDVLSGYVGAITFSSGNASPSFDPVTYPLFFRVSKGIQSFFAITDPGTPSYVSGGTFTVSTSGGKGSGAVTWESSTPGVATVSGDVVTIKGIGTTTLTATKAGDAQYEAAVATRELTVVHGDRPGFSLPATLTKVYGDGQFSIPLSGAVGSGAVSWSSSTPGVVSLSGGVISIVGTGTTEIRATQSSDNLYTESVASCWLTVARSDQSVLSITSPGVKRYGDSDFTLSYTGGSGTGAISWESSDPDVASVSSSGEVKVYKVGSTAITLRKAGDLNHDAASTSLPLVIAPGLQSALSINSVGSKFYGDVPFTLSASGGSGSGVLRWSSSDVGVASIDAESGLVYIHRAGDVTFSVVKSSDANYAESESSLPFTIGKSPESISIALVPAKIYGDVPFSLEVSGGGPGEVSYDSSAPEIASIDGSGLVTIHGAGEVILTAARTSSLNYAASSSTLSLSIGKASQSVSIQPVSSKIYGDAPFTLTCIDGSDIGVIRWSSSAPGVATIDAESGLVSIVGAGEVTFTATRVENATYLSESADWTLSVGKASQSIAVSPVSAKRYGDADFTLTSTVQGKSGEGLLSWSSSDESVATVDAVSGLVHIIGAGNVTFTATKAGDPRYLATEATQTVSITRSPQFALSIASIGSKRYGDAPFRLSTVDGSGTGEVTWSSAAPEIAEVDASTGEVTIRNAGEVTFAAVKLGDANYLPREATLTLSIGRASLSVSALPASAVYREALPELRVSYAGFAYGDDSTALTSLPVAVTEAISGDSVGTYAITVSGGESRNYELSYQGSALTIEKRAPAGVDLYITSPRGVYSGKSTSTSVKVYDEFAGFGVISGVRYNGSSGSPVLPGRYAVTVNMSSGRNYTSASGLLVDTFVIERAPLSVLSFSINNGVSPDQSLVYPADIEGLGEITLKFNGGVELPTEPGEYLVTIDHVDGAYYLDAFDYEIGTYTVIDSKGPLSNGSVESFHSHVWSSGSTLLIESSLPDLARIYTLDGALYTTLPISPYERRELVLPSGIYIVTLSDRSYKILLR
jgi:uncharacterized protein YjdB